VKKGRRISHRQVHKDGTESELERLFLSNWISMYPKHAPLTQIQFARPKLWKFDFGWPAKLIAVEVQGMGPGHCSLEGMTKDYNKQLAALLMGWRVVYLTKTHLSQENVQNVCNDIARLLGIYTPSIPSSGYIPLKNRK
jgi:hypothetical protein